MDVDGFDPYEDEYEWRDALEVMGEDFQEKLAAKGLTRRFRKKLTVPDPPSVTAWLNDGVVGTPGITRNPEHTDHEHLDRLENACKKCHGLGEVEDDGFWDQCLACGGTGDGSRKPTNHQRFEFKSF